jgi:hypothetical protein
MLRLHLPLPWKRMPGIKTKLMNPFAQYILVDFKIATRLRKRYATVGDQINRLELELAAELPSSHLKPPVPSKHLNSVSVKPAAGQTGQLEKRAKLASWELIPAYWSFR